MNRNKISHVNIKVPQIITWFFSVLTILTMIIFLVLDFSFNTVVVMLVSLVFILLIQYFNSKAWNICCKGDEIIFENIYKTHKRNIDLFKKIEKSGFIGNYYTFCLNNGESYYFKINPLDDLKLFFKNDRNFYANKINEQMKNYIRIEKRHTLH